MKGIFQVFKDVRDTIKDKKSIAKKIMVLQAVYIRLHMLKERKKKFIMSLPKRQCSTNVWLVLVHLVKKERDYV